MSSPDFTSPWVKLPDGMRLRVESFVFSDAHGDAFNTARIMSFARKESRGHAMVFLGDAVDRGPDSLAVMSMINEAREDGSFTSITSIMGNHEQVLISMMNGEPDGAEGVLLMGGGQLIKALEKGGEAAEKIVRTYISGLTSYNVNGDVAFCHAIPDPSLPLSDQSDVSLMWSKSNQHYKGGWSRLVGRPCLLVHGHTANAFDVTAGDIEERGAMGAAHIEKSLAEHKRLCVDNGPVGALSLYEFSRDAVRLHAFIR